MSELLDLLLRPEVQNVGQNLPTKKVRMKRLSKVLKQDVVFTIRALPYGSVEVIKQSDGDRSLNAVLAGLVDPDPKDEKLNKKFNAVTPKEMLKHMLLPGEIDDLSIQIELLSGYRGATIEEVKNDSGTEETEN